jgi:hypothetical protein
MIGFHAADHLRPIENITPILTSLGGVQLADAIEKHLLPRLRHAEPDG